MPDIMLLPLIADIFDTSIDELFERTNGTFTPSKDEIFDSTVDNLLKGIFGYFNRGTEECSKGYKDYRSELSNTPHTRTGIMNCGKGSVFYTENTGAIALVRSSNRLFETSEACKMLDMLGDPDTRRILRDIFEMGLNSSFTAASIAKKANCDVSAAQKSLDELEGLGFILSAKCDMADETVTVYSKNGFSSGKFFMCEVIDAFAKELSEHKSYMYCWEGNFK